MLGVPHLESFWLRHSRPGGAGPPPEQWAADNTMLAALRLGLHETLQFLYLEKPSAEQFAQWVLERNGGALDRARVERLSHALEGRPLAPLPMPEPVLSAADLAYFDEHGYTVLHDAVPQTQCAAAAQALYEFVHVDPGDPETWYGGPQGHSIWVPLIHHPAFWRNRDAPRIHAAFAQLWGTADLWVNADQGGFHPPERDGWPFPGPHLHWDVSLARPVPFGLQGILYLTDTAATQGAFQCVPGFHRRIDLWLESLPAGTDPRREDLEALGPRPIAGRAGDLIIWHHALPHGATPNRAALPRVVQYLTLRPAQWASAAAWV